MACLDVAVPAVVAGHVELGMRRERRHKSMFHRFQADEIYIVTALRLRQCASPCLVVYCEALHLCPTPTWAVPGKKLHLTGTLPLE